MQITCKEHFLHLSGEFTQEELVQESYIQIDYKKNTKYTLCCHKVTGLGTFFVVWLVGLQRNLHQHGSSFHLQDPSPKLQRLIKLYRLQAVL